MSVSLPTIGYTVNSSIILKLLEHHPEKVLATFWVMCRDGLSMELPDFWEDIILQDNQAQRILEYLELGYIEQSHADPLYYGLVIAVVDTGNFLDFHYMIRQIRINTIEGIPLLQELSKHNILTIPCIYSPADFLNTRFYHTKLEAFAKEYKIFLRQSLSHWSAQVWQDYCDYLMSQQGRRIYDNVITSK